MITAQDRASETYNSVRRVIDQTVAQFTRRHGGDEEEHRSIADLVYWTKQRDWDAVRGSFKRRIISTIWYELLTQHRKRHGFRRKSGHEVLNLDDKIDLLHIPTNAPRDWDLQDWLTDLSEDAEVVAAVVLDPPVALMQLLPNNPTPAKVRQCVRAWLVAEGWTSARVTRAWNEVKEAL